MSDRTSDRTGASPQIVLVAAIGENHVIGRDNQLPWRLPSDLRHFRGVTIHKPVVMGRKTYESIGKPLPDRTNIVVSRDLGLRVPGAVLATSLDAALAAARKDARQRGIGEIMVIGGSGIFEATMPLAGRLEITHVHAAPEGDVFFPPIDPAVWEQTSWIEHPQGKGDSAAFAVAIYRRR
jgi:dihydrofolate reductase